MNTLSRLLLAVLLLMGVALHAPGAQAQSAAELNVRMRQVEEQMRQLMGQVEALSFQVRQLQNQIATSRKTSAVEPEPQPQPARKQKIAAAASMQQGIEQIGSGGNETGEIETIVAENGEEKVVIQKARAPRILGTLPGTTFDEQSGPSFEGQEGTSFEGQVLVAPQPQETTGGGQQVETVALAPATGDSAEQLYERSYESLLRRRFGEAETGFRSFLSQHRDHGLAGNAQYWLGETYYVQSDYKTAAQAFLTGVQEFPKSRKAADSLLKLGLSLNRLGQKQQACSAYAAVGVKFPKAAEAKKRADAESKRAGC